MIVDADLVAGEQARQLAALELRGIDGDRRVVATDDAPPHQLKLLIAVDEDGLHLRNGANAPPPAAPSARVPASARPLSRSLPRTRISAPDGPIGSDAADRRGSSGSARDRDRP